MKQEHTKQKKCGRCMGIINTNHTCNLVKLPVLKVEEELRDKLKKEATRQGVNDMSIIRRKAYKAYLG